MNLVVADTTDGSDHKRDLVGTGQFNPERSTDDIERDGTAVQLEEDSKMDMDRTEQSTRYSPESSTGDLLERNEVAVQQEDNNFAHQDSEISI